MLAREHEGVNADIIYIIFFIIILLTFVYFSYNVNDETIEINNENDLY